MDLQPIPKFAGLQSTAAGNKGVDTDGLQTLMCERLCYINLLSLGLVSHDESFAS